MSVEDRDRDSCETEMANMLITRAMITTMIRKLAPCLLPCRNIWGPPVELLRLTRDRPAVQLVQFTIPIYLSGLMHSYKSSVSLPIESRRAAMGLGMITPGCRVRCEPCCGRASVRPIVIAIRSIAGMILDVKVTSSSLLY